VLDEVLGHQVVLNLDMALDPIQHKGSDFLREYFMVLVGGICQGFGCGPQVFMESHVLSKPGIIGGSHPELFFFAMFIKKIKKEFDEIRDMRSMEITVDCIKEVIEFRYQAPVLLIDGWIACLPLWIPYKLTHNISFWDLAIHPVAALPPAPQR